MDNVTVHSSYTVIPSHPTPTPILPSSSCEQIKLPTHAPLLYVYKPFNPHHHNAIIHTLHSSLSQILVPYYPLAGRLCWLNQSQSACARWQLHCNSEGATLSLASCALTLDDLGDFAPTHTLQHLIPNLDYTLPIQHVPLLAIQLTRFSCGALTLGVAMCRAVIDGTAAMRFVNSWAKLARGELLLPADLPVHDRTLLDSYSLHTPPRFDHSEFHPPPLWLGRLQSDHTKAVVAVLKLTTDQVKKLKEKAMMSTTALASPKRAYTSFEVIAGHVWRCVSKARYDGNNNNQPTRLSTLANCRNRLEPPLPSGYAGNAAFPTVTPTCCFQDLIQKPLGYAVGHVREALERVRDEYVRSAMDYIGNNIDDEKGKGIKMMRYNFHYPASSVLELGEERGYMGNSNLFVVSWMNFAYREADFGWGKPVYFGPGFMDSEGKAFVMNSADGDGLRVAICLLPQHMDAFKTFFYKDHILPASKL